MTQQPEETDQAPAPGIAAPVPDSPQATAVPPWEAPPPARGDVSSRIAELEGELTRLRAEAAAGAKVLLRVLKPHVSFTHGGVTVGAEPTPVPAHAVGPLTEAAGQAGVKIEEA